MLTHYVMNKLAIGYVFPGQWWFLGYVLASFQFIKMFKEFFHPVKDQKMKKRLIQRFGDKIHGTTIIKILNQMWEKIHVFENLQIIFKVPRCIEL